MNQQLDPFNTKPKKKNAQRPQNFIEAFKDISRSTIKSFAKDVVAGTGKNAFDVLTKGQTRQTDQQPQPQQNIEALLKSRERRIRQQERTRFESIRREETIIFSRQQKEVKVQIETIQVEIQKLAKDQVGLMKEVDKASFQAIVNPGKYHKNFFERLMSLIKLARKKVSESRSWLQMFNSRSNQQKGYWQKAQKHGTKFTLSQERYMSTQAG